MEDDYILSFLLDCPLRLCYSSLGDSQEEKGKTPRMNSIIIKIGISLKSIYRVYNMKR